MLLFRSLPTVRAICGCPLTWVGASFANKPTVWSANDLERLATGYTGNALFKEAKNETDGAFTIGCGFDYFFANSFTVCTGLSVDYTPAKIKYPKNNADTDINVIFDFWFLNIPLGVHYFGKYFACGAGLYFDLVLSDSGKVEFGNYPISIKTKDLDFSNDVGIFVDLGVHFNITERMDIALTGRFKNGFTKVYSKDDLITDIKMRSLFFILSLGFKL